MRRLFDVDPIQRKRTIFHYEDEGSPSKDKIVLQHQQDVGPIMDYNTFKYNVSRRFGDVCHVARIPKTIWESIPDEIKYDDKALDKWLDDSSNRAWRTKSGRLS